MESLTSFVGQELLWVKPKVLRTRYELHAGEQVIAALQVQGRSATGEANGATYIFKRQGFFKQHILIEQGTDADALNAGDYAVHGGGGVLMLPDGRTLHHDKARILSNERVWKDAADSPLISIHPASWSGKVKVIIEPAGATLPELALVVLLAQYLTVIAQQDSAVVAAVVPAVTG